MFRFSLIVVSGWLFIVCIYTGRDVISFPGQFSAGAYTYCSLGREVEEISLDTGSYYITSVRMAEGIFPSACARNSPVKNVALWIYPPHVTNHPGERQPEGKWRKKKRKERDWPYTVQASWATMLIQFIYRRLINLFLLCNQREWKRKALHFPISFFLSLPPPPTQKKKMAPLHGPDMSVHESVNTFRHVKCPGTASINRNVRNRLMHQSMRIDFDLVY